MHRYATPEGEAAIVAQQRRRYEREKAEKPEVMERRRQRANAYARKQRAEASGKEVLVGPPKKRGRPRKELTEGREVERTT